MLNNSIYMPSLVSGRKKIWSSVSVIFSLFYFLPYFYTVAPPFGLGALVLAYVIFLFIYVCAIRSQVPQVFMYLIVVGLICFFSSLLTFGGLFLFTYVAFVTAYHLPFATGQGHSSDKNLASKLLLQSRTWLLVILLLITLRWALQDEYSLWLNKELVHWDLIALTPIYAAVLMLFSFGFLERRETLITMQHKRSQEEIEQISTIAERERIGRDLHDIVGHSLTSISVKADLANKLLARGKNQEAQQEIKEVARISRDILSDVRKAVSHIKNRSLLDEIRSMVKLLESKALLVKIDINESELRKLDLKTESQVVLILQELVTNILRHSQASEVSLTTAKKDQILLVSVHDNGDVSDIKFGNGLTGIQERCRTINAKVDFSYNKGFRCDLQLALK